MQNIELAVVIPVYNESGIIEKVIGQWTETLMRLNINCKLHAYNDGSRDGTLQILQNIENRNNLLVVHDKVNTGHGPTIIKGYRENLNAEWIFQIDSDNSMSPDYFHLLWEKREDYDFLIGKRNNRISSPMRRTMSSISRATVKFLYGPGIWDVNSPYRLMRVSALKKIFLAIPEDTFAPNIIVSGFVCYKKLRCLEIAIPYHERTTGEVSIKKSKLLKISLTSFLQTEKFARHLDKI